MSGDISAAMDVVTGALAAHTVEPRTGDDGAGGGHVNSAGGICLNCGTRRIGAYCHACGQSSHTHRTIGAIGHELAHGVFHFEGKIWRTLPMLVFHPGQLTRRYIDGERARFVSPLALFLFIIFVLFAMLSVAGKQIEAPAFDGAESAVVRQRIDGQLAVNAQAIARLGERRAATMRAGSSVATIDAEIEKQTTEAKAMRATRDAMRPDGTGIGDIKTGWHRLDEGLHLAAENPNLLIYKMQSNAYKFAWALIPISLPFVWLLFPFSRRFAVYDHAIFVTYSLCFMLGLIMVLSIVAMVGIGGTLLPTLVALAVPLHMYKQLRGTYATSRLGAFVRTICLFFLATVAIVVFVLLLLGLGLLG